MLHERLLVPLDGSEFSDQAVAQIGGLLARPQANVRLLTAVDELPFRYSLRPLRGARDDEILEARREKAQEHLERVAAGLGGGVATSLRVRQGQAAEAILEEVAEHPPSLVAMMTHGRRGLSHLLHGSVAGRVMRHCPAPLLLLRGVEEPAGPLALRRILVALDGSERAARILPLVTELATPYDAEVVLFSAGWSEPVDLAPSYEQEIAEVKAQYAEAHAPHLAALKAAGLKARSVIEWGLPADEIANALTAQQADLLALTTHGRTGFGRFLLGSVAETALRLCHVPVLLLRTADD